VTFTPLQGSVMDVPPAPGLGSLPWSRAVGTVCLQGAGCRRADPGPSTGSSLRGVGLELPTELALQSPVSRTGTHSTRARKCWWLEVLWQPSSCRSGDGLWDTSTAPASFQLSFLPAERWLPSQLCPGPSWVLTGETLTDLGSVVWCQDLGRSGVVPAPAPGSRERCCSRRLA